jgi:NADP-dependent 3-hydroxy acid dehydrogenase YdfG
MERAFREGGALSDVSASPLAGTVAVVTGASSGIGDATARRLAAVGATAVLVARRGERLDRLRAEIQVQGGQAIVMTADITQPGQPEAVVDTVATLQGRLDILVNNAGIMLVGPMQHATVGDWDRMIDLNFRALTAMSHAAVPHLLSAAESHARVVADVVNISSVSGLMARSGNGVYSATKFAVGAFTESMRQEFATRYLRASVIEPGSTDTELSSHVPPEIMAERRRLMPAIVRMSADDVARVIEFVVTQPRDIALNEVVVRPTTQP